MQKRFAAKRQGKRRNHGRCDRSGKRCTVRLRPAAAPPPAGSSWGTHARCTASPPPQHPPARTWCASGVWCTRRAPPETSPAAAGPARRPRHRTLRVKRVSGGSSAGTAHTGLHVVSAIHPASDPHFCDVCDGRAHRCRCAAPSDIGIADAPAMSRLGVNPLHAPPLGVPLCLSPAWRC